MNNQLACIVICVLWVLLPVNAGQNGDVLTTGRSATGRIVEKLHWSGTEKNHVLISYPGNFDSKKTYHLNFWFPGTSGVPGPGIEDSNDNYIGILMSYLDEPIVSNKDYVAHHWSLCLEVEATLLQRKPFKVGQHIVSGVSKGGWLAFFMSMEAPKGLDGVAIIAAGRDLSTKVPRDLSRSGLSVLVCTGESDPNYPCAQLASAFYKVCKLKDYTYEEWLGKGHVSEISPRVQQWLNMVAMRMEPRNTFVAYCEDQSSAEWEKIKKMPDALDQYRTGRHLMNSPCMLHVSAQFRERVATWGLTLSKEAKVTAWLEAYGRLGNIVRLEMKIYESGTLDIRAVEKLDDNFRQLAMQSKYADIQARAAHGHMRSRKVLTMLKLQEQARLKPEYKKLETDFRELYDKVSKLRSDDPVLTAVFNAARNDLATKHSQLRMDAFYQVEWYRKFSMDEKIKPLLDVPLNMGVDAYSGVHY